MIEVSQGFLGWARELCGSELSFREAYKFEIPTPGCDLRVRYSLQGMPRVRETSLSGGFTFTRRSPRTREGAAPHHAPFGHLSSPYSLILGDHTLA